MDTTKLTGDEIFALGLKMRKELRAWNRKSINGMKARLLQSGAKVHENKAKEEKRLVNDLRSYIRMNDLLPERLGFTFPRHGVFFYKGAGRGWSAKGGRLVRTAKGVQTGTRTRKDWFNPVIEKNINSLTDIVANNSADFTVNASRMLIN
jgi:hypothetical protein